ncbi:hypothetical protein [Myxococcus llanfairpwllgwyngyllgogerychwyrndrobwllllantysiliogogogochensis]|nr:hypothetical protein [Myxococcus llanfairpwllgwyngyllgogerychwyrndrobwllllantysiliogogogochensis]
MTIVPLVDDLVEVHRLILGQSAKDEVIDDGQVWQGEAQAGASRSSP